jgi:hypothetical protein
MGKADNGFAGGAADVRDKHLSSEAAPDHTADSASRNSGHAVFAGPDRHGRERALLVVRVGWGTTRGTGAQQRGHYQRNPAKQWYVRVHRQSAG